MTKTEALKSGKLCLSKIKYKKHWKLRIFENLGWHWTLEAVNGFFTLHGGYNGEPQYWCLFTASEHKGVGDSVWSLEGSSSDPNRAIKNQISSARIVVNKIESRVRAAEKLLKP